MLRVASVAAAALLLTGCDEWMEFSDSGRYKEEFSQTHSLKAGGRLSVETLNGSVEITGWDRDEVQLTGTKTAATQELLRAVKIDVVSAPDALRIRTIPPGGPRGGVGARYILRVPRRVELERIVSSNGRVVVEDIEGPARIRTSNGQVKATRTRGAYEIETSNGAVDLAEHNGPATIRTSNGQVRADRVSGYFEAYTTNASISASLANPDPARPIKLTSTNGSITLETNSLRNDIYANTSNSSITVRLPANASAQLKARTSNASVSTDFDVSVRGEISKNRVDGAINGGGPLVDLSTSNGAIRVQRM